MRKTVSGIMLLLLLIGMLTLAFNIQPAKADQEPQILLETDKDTYTLGENVTIVLANIGIETVQIGGYPAWQIYTYPEEQPVYPAIFAFLAWSLEPGENDTFVWNQYNQFNETFCSSGTYVVKDTQGWGLSANFEIISANIIVPDDYLTIQEAINNANEGDVIFVRTGTYFENVVVNKSVSLVGENRENTIIDGQRIDTVIYVNALYVKITNFTVQNGAGFNGRPYAGISAYNSSNLSITYNIIKNNNVGIDCEIGPGGNCITILNNVILSNGNGIIISNYNNVTVANNTIIEYNLGLYIGGGKFHRISNNIIFCENKGLELSGIKNSTVVDNNVTAYGGTVLKLHYSNGCLVTTNLIIGGKNRNNGDYGIYLYSSSENTILHNVISMCKWGGIIVFGAENNTISNNTIMQCYSGLLLQSCKYNNISNNKLLNNSFAGLGLFDYSDRNVLVNNNVSYNGYGIYIRNAWYNVIYHNNFINSQQVMIEDSQNIIWDNGYPSGGNYWSDHTGVDELCGPNQDHMGPDGIGDTPYQIDENNQDPYPLMGPFMTFDAGTWNGASYNIDVVSNSTVSNFELNTTQGIISFDVAGPDFTTGFCRMTIPNIILETIWEGNYRVLVDGKYVKARNWTDTENTYIYFTYDHSEHRVTILQTYTTSLQIATTTGGTTDPPPGEYSYLVGDTVSVLAISYPNYKLDYWLLDGVSVGSQNPKEVLMDSNHSLQAIFTQITYQLSITSTDGGTTDPEPSNYTHVNGTTVSVTAVPNAGYSFAYWSLDGNVRTENPINITIDANHTLTAYFVDDIPPEIGSPVQEPSMDNVQPYQNVTVTVNVTDLGTGIAHVTLWYSIDNGTTWTAINMTEISTNTYQATIECHEYGTWVTYKIAAYDNAGNQAVNDNNSFFYQYYVIPEFPVTTMLLMFIMLSAFAVVIAKKRYKNQKL